MWNSYRRQLHVCIQPPKQKNKTKQHILVSHWPGYMEMRISKHWCNHWVMATSHTHLSQCGSCVMIWGVRTAVCLELAEPQGAGLSKRHRMGNIINRHNLLDGGKQKSLKRKVLINDDGSLEVCVHLSDAAKKALTVSYVCDLIWNIIRTKKHRWWWLELQPLTLWYKSHYSRWKTKREFLGFTEA